MVGDDFWSYVVLEGTAELTPVAADPADEARLGRVPTGMVADDRLVVRLRLDHAYGMASTS